jgi:hypothetical protein
MVDKKKRDKIMKNKKLLLMGLLLFAGAQMQASSFGGGLKEPVITAEEAQKIMLVVQDLEEELAESREQVEKLSSSHVMSALRQLEEDKKQLEAELLEHGEQSDSEFEIITGKLKRLEKRNRQLSSAGQQNDVLMRDNGQLVAELKVKGEEQAQLAQLQSQLRIKLQQAQKELAIAQDKIKSIRDEAANQNEDLRVALGVAVKRHEDVAAQEATFAQEHARSTQEVGRLNRKLQTAEAQMEGDLAVYAGELKAQQDKAQEALVKASAELQNLRTDRTSLEEELKVVQAQNVDFGDQVSELKAEVSTLNSGIAPGVEAFKEVGVLRAQIGQVQFVMDLAKQAHDAELQDLQDEHAIASAQAEQAKVAALAQAEANRIAELGDLTNEIEAMESIYELNVAAVAEHSESFQVEIAGRDEAKRLLVGELEEARQRLEAANSQVQGLTEECSNTTEISEQAIAQLRKELAIAQRVSAQQLREKAGAENARNAMRMQEQQEAARASREFVRANQEAEAVVQLRKELDAAQELAAQRLVENRTVEQDVVVVQNGNTRREMMVRLFTFVAGILADRTGNSVLELIRKAFGRK